MYANVYVTIQSHGLSAGARTHYVTVNGVRNGLRRVMHTQTDCLTQIGGGQSESCTCIHLVLPSIAVSLWECLGLFLSI